MYSNMVEICVLVGKENERRLCDYEFLTLQ